MTGKRPLTMNIINSKNTEKTIQHHSTTINANTLIRIRNKTENAMTTINAVVVNSKNEITLVLTEKDYNTDFQVNEDTEVIYVTFVEG